MSVLSQIRVLPQAEREETAREIRRICFVCTGNTCRSPMAAAVANALAAEQAARLAQKLPESLRDCMTPEWEATSAGLYATEGAPISRYAKEALEDAGILPVAGKDYREHRAHSLTDGEIEGFDLVVGLTSEHAMALIMEYPAFAKRIVAMPKDIPDPFGGDASLYRQTLEAIIEGVRTLLLNRKDDNDD